MDDPRLTYVADLRSAHDTRQQHAKAAANGVETRLARGVYASAESVRALSALDRYRLVVRAVAETRRNRPVISHWSALALYGISIMGPWPSVVHITQPPMSGLRSHGNIVRHSMPLSAEDVEEFEGILVTSIARTIVDVAAITNKMQGVVIADRALHEDRFGRAPALVTRDDLFAAWEQRLPFKGAARAREVIEFAETKSDSALESASRVGMEVIRCPKPVLQVAYYDARGFIGETDFTWPDHGLLGEADGAGKYLDARFRGGRTAEQVVLDEKDREDRLRALPKDVVRWRWKVGVNPTALARTLANHGLPVVFPR